MAALGSTPGIIVGVGVGAAASAALAPAIEIPKQDAWRRNPNRVLGVGSLAELVAKGGLGIGEAHTLAKRDGFDTDKVDALVYLAQTVPEVGFALLMYRRKLIGPELFEHALVRHGFDARYVPQIEKMRLTEPLDPADLARAIHRGLIPDPGLLEGELPSGVGNVPAYPVYPIPALTEAESAGYDHDHLGVLVGLQGNPMGAHEAAQAFFRHILTNDDYLRALAESNTRNEWANAIREQSRQIPTARDFLENALRGYRTLDQAIRGAELHGMSEAHATMIYQNQGRPMAVRLITQALARGGEFQPEPGEIRDPYRASIVEGNIKPAYYDLAHALRYTMPSPFVMRSLAQSGVWSEEKTATRLKWIGWYPPDADEAAAEWAKGSGGSTDPHVGKAQTQLWNTAHRSYLADESDDAAARLSLARAGVKAAAVDDVLTLWQEERALRRKQLTPAQVKKALAEAVPNPTTGQAWTKDEARAELIARGYSAADADTFLSL